MVTLEASDFVSPFQRTKNSFCAYAWWKICVTQNTKQWRVIGQSRDIASVLYNNSLFFRDLTEYCRMANKLRVVNMDISIPTYSGPSSNIWYQKVVKDNMKKLSYSHSTFGSSSINFLFLSGWTKASLNILWIAINSITKCRSTLHKAPCTQLRGKSFLLLDQFIVKSRYSWWN